MTPKWTWRIVVKMDCGHFDTACLTDAGSPNRAIQYARDNIHQWYHCGYGRPVVEITAIAFNRWSDDPVHDPNHAGPTGACSCHDCEALR